MKILYVCHRFPYPPKSGSTIRPFYMIKHLNQNHDVTVAALVRSVEEAKNGEGLKNYCKNYVIGRVGALTGVLRMLRRLPTPVPSSMGYFYSGRLARRIRQELASSDYDLIFVHCSSVAQYVEDVSGPARIIDFADMDSQKWLSYGKFRRFPVSIGYYIEGLKLQLCEIELARKFDCCTFTTPTEQKTLEGLAPGARTDWFPNGVDTDRFKPNHGPYDPDTICFVGRMDYFPNQECMVDFCANTLPIVRAKRPNTRLMIVGAHPSQQVRKLGKLPGVIVTGSVPEVQPYLRQAALHVAPLSIARGTQNKILESMAMGVPNVCSALAARGVDVVPGEHLLTASSPTEYASAILRLLEDRDERRRFAEAGRARVLKHHSWAKSMNKLDTIIEDCLRARGNLLGKGESSDVS